ncbi:MAG: hypothetical protein ACMUEL_00415 [Flavobacteriales bacterium Tduv]
MILAVHSVVANEHNSIGVKPLARLHTQHLMEAMTILCIVPLALLCAVHKNRYN